MKGENSVERVSRMIKDVDQEIEFLRGCELDTRRHVEELSEQLKTAMQELEDIQDQKMDALYTKMAFMQFVSPVVAWICLSISFNGAGDRKVSSSLYFLLR